MKKFNYLILITVFLLLGVAIVLNKGFPQEKECFFKESFHYDAHGMAYWYSKENGGIEQLTGIPYNQLVSCKKCHAESCDRCHKTEVEGIPAYSVKKAKSMENCLSCHKREKTLLELIKRGEIQDVHFSKGMECMSCHTAREIHGDGKRYVSMREKGAMDVKCENCHQKSSTISHTIHKDKLDCTACHVYQVITCANCHMDTDIKTGKRVSITLRNWVFLINYYGKVVSGNIQTFVVKKNQTFVVYAPYFSHHVVKSGRSCEECHGTDIVKEINKGEIEIIDIENGTLNNIKGVIPIVEGVKYKSAYMEYIDDKWIPLKNPEEPLQQFVAFGEPLTKDQLKKLMMPFKNKK